MALKILFHDHIVPYVGTWSYLEAFRRAGHEGTFVSYRAGMEGCFKTIPGRLFMKIMKDVPDSARRKHYAILREKIKEWKPDIFITAGGHYLGRELIDEIKRLSVWTVNVSHDDFFSRIRSNWTYTQRNALSSYDQILTTREVNVHEIKPLNSNVEFFPFAFDPSIHRVVDIPANEKSKWDADVVFVGQWAEHRAAMLEKLVERLPAKYSIHGPTWERLRSNSPLKRYVSNTHIWGDDMAKAIGGARISLGFLRKENRDDYTQRSFEIPACGGMLLAERTPMHLRFFQEGVNAEFFDSASVDELVNQVERLLKDEEHRESVRKAGHSLIWESQHTFDHRVQRILDLYHSQRA
jgi:spore maturation protein CgeB